ncbi:MAG: GxxExxY protein [Chitinophagaceae bacterium]|jgi:GxxExxY protein|nr:GxxExxY protein [Chitinophagaceae bacterium]
MSVSYQHSELTELVIKAFYEVYNKLCYGFLEKIYEKALLIELKKMGLDAVSQMPIDVYYENEKIGVYFADIVVENVVIIELKAGEALISEHEAQLLNYLRATDIEVGLLLNFGKTQQVKRKAFSNQYKNRN